MVLEINNYNLNKYKAININNKIYSASSPSFGSIKTLKDDLFQRNTKFPDVTIKSGNCYGVFTDSNMDSELYLANLWGNSSEGEHKGDGTKIIQCGVKESIKRGYNGKMAVWAVASLPFYYKSNFNFQHGDVRDAILQYVIKNDISPQDVIPHYWSANMKLDEEGAQAILDGNRLYKDRIYIKAGEKSINGTKHSSNFIQSPFKGEYFILIADEEEKQPVFIASIKEKENDKGKKHFTITDISYEYRPNKENTSFAIETIEKLAKEKNYDKTTVEDSPMIKKVLDKYDIQYEVENKKNASI